jgi:hypothetical protein
MPVKRVETSSFVMVAYNRKSGQDFEQLHVEVDPLYKGDNQTKDIVLDFSACSVALTPELSMIAEILNKLKGSTRKLILIPGVDMQGKLEKLRIDKLPNLAIYKDLRSLISARAAPEN